MNQPMLPPEETTLPPEEINHSFVLRLWQETPGQWRGTIRHVQDESRLSFTRLDQAVRWIERAIKAEQPAATPIRARKEMTGLGVWWSKLPRFERTPTWAVAGLLALVVLVVVLMAPIVPGPLAGTAVGAGGELSGVIPFVAGLLLGGVAVALWTRSRPRR